MALVMEADELLLDLEVLRLPIGVAPVTPHQIKIERVYQMALRRYLRRERAVLK